MRPCYWLLPPTHIKKINRNEDDEDKRVEAIIDTLPDDLPDHRLGPGKATWLNNTASMMKGWHFGVLHILL
jgi:hypothetical protein